MAYWWVPLIVASISIVPGLLAWHAARGVRTEVTTNHGKRLGEYVELLAEKTDLIELKQDTQHASLANQISQLSAELRQHMDIEESTQVATRRAVERVAAQWGRPRMGSAKTTVKRATGPSRAR